MRLSYDIPTLLDPANGERAMSELGMTAIEPREMPEPYRRLLVHDRDMTPTLEDWFRSPITLRLLNLWHDGRALIREVLLLLTADQRPVEIGMIRIELERFDEPVRRRILECRQPLGSILHEFRIAHACRPSAWVSLAPNERMRALLAADGAAQPAASVQAAAEPAASVQTMTLYGRRNVIVDPHERTLASVIEILPPLSDIPQEQSHD